MIKKLLAALAMMMFAIASFAAVDANKGSAAELDGIKGIGPAMSNRIIDARKQGEFKNWDDFMARVKGVKTKTATKLSAAGLTVNGEAFKGDAAATTPAKAPAKTKKDKSTDAAKKDSAGAAPASAAPAPAPAASTPAAKPSK